MLVLPHAVTAGALLYIELIAGKLDLISILALSLAFHAITLERRGFKENHKYFDLRCPLSTRQYFQDEQTLQK